MRNKSIATLIAAVAICLLGAPLAHAQSFQQGQPFHFRYQDSDGIGDLFLTDQGPDTASGGDRIAIVIQQNGNTFPGAGVLYPIQTSTPPLRDLLVFWVMDIFGDVFFFDGTTTMGVDTISGQGTYTFTRNQNISDQWSIFWRPGLFP